MSDKKKIYKPRPISGFPEWLPEERLIEQQWFDRIRAVFESYGFCSIETPSVEELDVISAKGSVDKEIYVLERLHADDDDKGDARLGLHFDQTVPLARYVAQHFNDLIFPFKRYQMQKVWRGERPQMGRMREFYQCDIDVIGVDQLPIHFDAEVAAIMYEVIEALDIGRVQMRISNRKIIMGLIEALGIADPVPVTRTIDMLDKTDRHHVINLLQNDCGMSESNANLLLDVVALDPSAQDLDGLLRDFIARNDVIARSGRDDAIQTVFEGAEELKFVLDNLSHLPGHAVVGDLSIIRGLDYYTGTVYETQLLDVPEFTGSVCSGGRYDDLASAYINKKLPGVGISLGFTRLFDVMRQVRRDQLGIGPKSAADILMVLPNEDQRALAYDTARTLRERGYKVEMYHAPQKIGKQIGYAEKKGIRYVWFPPFEDGQEHEVKDLQTGEQSSADPKSWKS